MTLASNERKHLVSAAGHLGRRHGCLRRLRLGGLLRRGEPDDGPYAGSQPTIKTLYKIAAQLRSERVQAEVEATDEILRAARLDRNIFAAEQAVAGDLRTAFRRRRDGRFLG